MKIMNESLQISKVSPDISKSDFSENSILTKVTPKSSVASSYEEHIYEDANLCSSDGMDETSLSETYEEHSYNISEAHVKNSRSGSFSAMLKSFSYNNVFFKSEKESEPKKKSSLKNTNSASNGRGIIRDGSINYQNISYEDLFKSAQSLPQSQNFSYGFEYNPTKQCSFKKSFIGPH
jgi:hypothetical protein